MESPVSFLSLFLAGTSWACVPDVNTLKLFQFMVVGLAPLLVISKTKVTSCCFVGGTNLGLRGLGTLSAAQA